MLTFIVVLTFRVFSSVNRAVNVLNVRNLVPERNAVLMRRLDLGAIVQSECLAIEYFKAVFAVCALDNIKQSNWNKKRW